MKYESRTVARFWKHYDALPEDIRRLADKQFGLFRENPQHPSLRLKPVGSFWSVRVTDAYRALALRKQNGFVWFWIGKHDDYEAMLKSTK